MSTLVTFAYWSMFSLVAVLALSSLVGTIWRNMQLSTARVQVDDGSEDPDSASFRVYRISLNSGALAVLSGIALLPLLAAAVLAVVGSTVFASAVGIALATVSFVAGDALRTRHVQYEKEFLLLSGRTVQEIHAEVIDRMTPPNRPSYDDQSVTSS